VAKIERLGIVNCEAEAETIKETLGLSDTPRRPAI
jgi:hypothetical protein